MTVLLRILKRMLVIAFVGVTARLAAAPHVEDRIYYHNGLGHPNDWRVDRAQLEAIADIRAGHLKIYLGDLTIGRGGAVGIPIRLSGLFPPCTPVDPGFTDVIDGSEDEARRERENEYARIYNQTIVRYLLVTNGLPVSRLEEALADKVGEQQARDRISREALRQVEERRKKRKAAEVANQRAPQLEISVVRVSPNEPLITLGHHDSRSYIDVVFTVTEPAQYRGRKLEMRVIPEFCGKLFDCREFRLHLPQNVVEGSGREARNGDGVIRLWPNVYDYWNFEAVMVAAIPEATSPTLTETHR